MKSRRLDLWFIGGTFLIGVALSNINPWWLMVLVGIVCLSISFDNYMADRR